MDVRCGRCGTEYEFDDALISERGTTVKCTNCGYQFKVFPDAAAAAPERWVVRTVAGRELVYTTLKDLQRGIAKGHVSAADMLSRGNRPARPLSAIPELEPFLNPGGVTIAQRRAPRTLQGVAPAANASVGGDAPPSLALPEYTPSVAPQARPQSLTPAWDQSLEAQRPSAPAPAASRPAPAEARPAAPVAARSAPASAPRPAAAAESRPGAPAASRPAASEARGVAPGASRPAPASEARAVAPASRPAPAAREPVRFPSTAPNVTIPGGISLTAPTVRRTPPGGTGLLHDLPPSVPPGARSAPPPPPSDSPAPAEHFDATEPPTIPRYLSLHAPAANGQAPQVEQRTAREVVPTGPNGVPSRDMTREVREAREARAVQGAREVLEAPENAVARGLEEARALLQHDDQTDPYYVRSPTRRNARSRWLVLVVVLAAGVLLAGTVGKRYLAKYTKGSPLAASQADATVTSLLAEGERLLSRGELEGANDAFAKASARAENNGQVLTSLATLEVVRADLLWLKERLLGASDEAARAQTRRELARQVVRVRGAVERTKLIVPEAPSTARLLVHAKRLDGDVAEARRHVSVLGQDASLPENAYALAALDMAEAAPVWSSIVHRLRIAAGAEGQLGLARAALVYALARSNETDAAKAELEKLAKSNPSHPLIFDLRAFLGQNTPAATSATEANAEDAGVEPGPNAPPSGDTGDAVGGDFRSQLKQAYAAVEQGQLAKAEKLYNAVLARQPGNTEALSGLADIAHRRNDTGKASRLYEEVLKKNPSYLPALMANADQKWGAGDRAGALALYRRILQQAGADSSYGRRAAQRIAQAESEPIAAPDTSPVTEAQDSATDTASDEAAAPAEPAPADESPAPAPAPPDEPAPPREPEGEAPPHIDTTDLPELNQ